MYKVQIAMSVLLQIAICVSGICLAQTPTIPTEGTPWQRLLPPPRAIAGQHEAQAKLLSRLRDILQNDPSKGANSPTLSDDEIQSLKKAMKQFGGNLPDGLSPDILDSIPPEMISKALSNPELMRQAKEMADQYLKKDSPGRNTQRTKPGESTPSQSPENTQTPKENSTRPRDSNSPPSPGSNDRTDRNPEAATEPTSNPAERSTSEIKPKGDDFKELMNKLLKTQQQFEQSKEKSKDSFPPNDSVKDEFPVDNPFEERQPDRSTSSSAPASPSENNPQNKSNPTSGPSPSGSQAGSSRSGSAPRTTPANASPTGSPRSRADTPSNAKAPATQTPERNRSTPAPNQSKPETASNDSQRNRSQQPSNSPNSNSANTGNNSSNGGRASQPNAADSQDIRKEIDRKGFGPALQKIIDDAKAKVAQRPKPNESKPVALSPGSTKVPVENKGNTAANDSASRTSNPTVPPSTHKVTDSNAKPTTPRPPQPETDFSKGLKQAGNYLNNLWTQISRTNDSTTSASIPPSASSQSSSAMEGLDVPNPFNANTLTYISVMAILVALVVFAMRYRAHTEQVRIEKLQVQMAPVIDEIRTREDLVLAFHALAKQRFKAAQAWWTSGYVAQQFESKLPQHHTPMQTLSRLYDQARYYPVEHQLTSKQIDEAKLALKQCEG